MAQGQGAQRASPSSAWRQPVSFNLAIHSSIPQQSAVRRPRTTRWCMLPDGGTLQPFTRLIPWRAV